MPPLMFNPDVSKILHQLDQIPEHRPSATAGRTNALNNMQYPKSWYNSYQDPKSPTFKSSSDYNQEQELNWLVNSILKQEPSFKETKQPQNAMDVAQSDYLDTMPFDRLYNEDSQDYAEAYESNPSFQQALQDYLEQQNENEWSSKQSANQNTSEDKKLRLIKNKTAIVKTLPTVSSRMTTVAEKAATPAYSVSTLPELGDSLASMPPVTFGKGQKEFPMYRPASDNHRNFDHWVESVAKMMLSENEKKRVATSTVVPVVSDKPHVDSLQQQLEELKLSHGMI